MRIGISSLGLSWLILPEVLGFLDPERFDFYRNHSERAAIESMRKQYGINGIDELWIFLTTDPKSQKSFSDDFLPWVAQLKQPPLVRAWACQNIPDIRTEKDCRSVRNALFLLILHAHRRMRIGFSTPASEDTLYISLTGGRKTISADLQDAAVYFGCTLLFHIIDRDLHNQKELHELSWKGLQEPLPTAQATVFLPLRVGTYPFLDESILKRDFFSSTDFQMPEPEPNTLCTLESSTKLIDLIEQKTKNAFYFYENLLAKGELALIDRRNFLSIFTLSPWTIQQMRETCIGGSESKQSPVYYFLQSLPKAELHCHLGGVLDIAEVLEGAKLLEKEVQAFYKKNTDFKCWIKEVQKAVHSSRIDWLRKEFQNILDLQRYLWNAGFLLCFQNHSNLLEEVVYGPFLDSEQFTGIGIEAYEPLGDIQGSALLQSEAVLRFTVQKAVRKALNENVRYLELRCSPWNYTQGELKTGMEVYRIIAEELIKAEKEYSRHGVPTDKRLEDTKSLFRSGVLLIASRHRKMSQVYQYIELMEEIYEKDVYPEKLLGIDLAGQEQKLPPSRLREAFLPVMNRCQHITIHAGETEEVERVWEAVYYLNAERIGHGLTVKNNEELMQKIIDRGIALELCPSSNHQIVGFRTAEYPLRYYLGKGVLATLNTDNPGISRTNLTQEYLKAAQLTKGGLSILQILQVVKNGFSAAFLPLPERERLLLSVEQELYTHSIPLLQEVWKR
jgi:adenosine deaminase